jgi:hypothetical protein
VVFRWSGNGRPFPQGQGLAATRAGDDGLPQRRPVSSENRRQDSFDPVVGARKVQMMLLRVTGLREGQSRRVGETDLGQRPHEVFAIRVAVMGAEIIGKSTAQIRFVAHQYQRCGPERGTCRRQAASGIIASLFAGRSARTAEVAASKTSKILKLKRP